MEQQQIHEQYSNQTHNAADTHTTSLLRSRWLQTRQSVAMIEWCFVTQANLRLVCHDFNVYQTKLKQYRVENNRTCCNGSRFATVEISVDDRQRTHLPFNINAKLQWIIHANRQHNLKTKKISNKIITFTFQFTRWSALGTAPFTANSTTASLLIRATHAYDCNCTPYASSAIPLVFLIIV